MNQYLKTSYDDDPIMYAFLIGCVRWALGEEKVMDEYRKQTGDRYEPGTNGLERAIDRATGSDLGFLQRFSDWVELNLFGTPDEVYGKGCDD